MEQDKVFRSFGSDNWAPVHPRVMEALMECNTGHAAAYGDDPYTQTAEKQFDELFGCKTSVHFVWNGTGANASALSHISKRYGAILCTKDAHINCDECGAVEHFTGNKLISFDAPDGKLRPEMMTCILEDLGSQHRPQPGVVSITQSTELGTIYKPDEVRAIAEFAHENGMYLHMDGARVANAVAALDLDIADFTVKAGVDVLCFGGTKNGLMSGEAVVFFDEKLGKTFPISRKNCAQLSSKNRYIAAQFSAVLKDNLWIENGRAANKMAAYFAQELKKLEGIEIVQEVQANEIFLRMSEKMLKAVGEKYEMHAIGQKIYRLVCSFDTQREEIDDFIAIASKAI